MLQRPSRLAIHCRSVAVATVAVAVLAVPLAVISVPASSAASAGGNQAATAAAAQKRAGIGTAAAMAAPNCDAKLDRIKMPFVYAPPCIVPWPAGSNNGGATSQGVTAKTITIVAVGGSVADTDTNRSEAEQGWKDVFSLFENEFQTWGRQVKFIWEDFGANSTPDEVQQRAMATTIIDLKPFAVVAEGGGTVMNEMLAEAKIPTFSAGGAFLDTIKLAPYLWFPVEPGPSDPLVAMSAQFIAAQLMGKRAKWAGEADLRTKKRVFGLVYDTATTDPSFFNKYFAKYHVKLADEIAVTPGASFTQQAPTVIAKLKATGVTTIIDATDLETNIPLSDEAANELFYPEWVTVGAGAEDITLAARYDNQKEWAHAFGFGEFPVSPATDIWWNKLLDWYYGADKPTWRLSKIPPNYSTIMQLALTTFLGIDLAGPDLNPFTVRDGLFAYPPSGGAACGCTTMVQISFGGHGALPGYDNYSATNDAVEEWWDPKLVGPDELTAAVAPGLWRYMNGAKRYSFGQFPTTPQKFFHTAGTVDTNTIKTLPKNDEPPTYPCAGCPSTSGAG
jgi:hypothetical protein